MDEYILHLIVVAVGGVTILLVAHYSRKKWVEEHGEPTSQDRIRFWLCLLISYQALTLTVYFYPFAFIVFVATLIILSQIGVGPFSLFDERPGLKKDIFYGCTISAILAAITGLFIHST